MRGSGWEMGKEGWRETERDKGREGGGQNGEVRGRGVEGRPERGGEGGVMVGGRKGE